MNINEFVSQFKNHPILFVGTGFSLRYLNSSFTWDGLLRYIATEVSGSPEYYLDIKSKNINNGKYSFDSIAQILEMHFTDALEKDRNGKFKIINDKFYENMESGKHISRFKIYISELLSKLEIKEEKQEEIAELKKAAKNIGSIITTNYDQLIEKIVDFNPLIGNDILLSNPYGAIYKIHGCTSNAERIIITNEDYEQFDKKYELIRAQLLSLFIHNPIVFIGYSINDDNIKKILKTIFTYVEPNSEQALRIRNNFLLVEYTQGEASETTCEHDIDLEGFSTIRINKIKTDNFSSIYKALSSLKLPVSAMDVRKVQNIVQELQAGGEIKVHITEDLEELKNGDRIIAIGSNKSITYKYMNVAETISNYFKIIDEDNEQLLLLINQFTISKQQFFPIFAFSSMQPNLHKAAELKTQQLAKIKETLENTPDTCKSSHKTIEEILADQNIAESNKRKVIFWCAMNKTISIECLETYLRDFSESKTTDYRKLLCVFDYLKYGGNLLH
ncbi:SIR2 family protein [Leeia oryzae]|uniref:SIR2 family protein n=1 Tax=Leeia oryzae TaxID=356662 RepID=UPI00035CDF3A|nr:SIR2 family protein [Leeia oryzae]